MGCGTGRILLPTARTGVAIHGVDLSAEMLDRLREKLSAEPAAVRERVSLIKGDVCSTEAGRKFALVSAPFRVAQLLPRRDDQRRWLRNVRRHLLPGGALCFDVFQPDYRRVAGPTGPTEEVNRLDPDTGLRTRRLARTTPHPELQLIDVHFQWLVEDPSGARVSESSAGATMRWFTRAELENLLELEGFTITDYWGSFGREPFGEGSHDQVIRATLSRS